MPLSTTIETYLAGPVLALYLRLIGLDRVPIGGWAGMAERLDSEAMQMPRAILDRYAVASADCERRHRVYNSVEAVAS